MPTRDYDVFVCYGEPAGKALGRTIAAGLARRGFRVFAEERAPGARGADPRRLGLIERTPDFVVVLPPETLESLTREDEPVRIEVAHAVSQRRNVVEVHAAGEPSDAARHALSNLFALRRGQAVTYDESRAAESIALVAHRLSSDGTVDERRLMERSKILFWIAGLVLVAGIALQEVPRLIEEWSRPKLLAPIPPFALYWAGVGQRQQSGRWAEFPVGLDTAVSSGDQLRVVFAPSADGYAYVVLQNARGEVDVLFPTDTVRGASAVRAGKLYFAPVGTGWLPVEDQSVEGTIYVIAGYDPLHNLEELIDQPDATPTARRQLLESTVGGLLDGRHGATERRVWTGKLHPIDPDLKPAAGPGTVDVTLEGGRTITRPLAGQVGLVSTSVEIKVTPR